MLEKKVTFRLTQEEWERIAQEVEKESKTVSEWLREATKSKPSL